MPLVRKPLTLLTAPGRIEIWLRGERFADYRIPENGPMGFAAIYAPEGRCVTSADEMGLALRIARANVDGVDFDTPPSSRPSGRILPVRTTMRRGTTSVGIQQECAWVAPDGKWLLTDIRTYRALPGPCEGGILDISLRLIAPPGRRVHFGSADHDLLRLRTAKALFPESGQIRNSAGDYGYEDMHRRSAAWCAGVGVLKNETVGFVLMEHPGNPFFPTDWSCYRDGSLSVSPTLWSSMASDLSEETLFRYRLMVHMGYVESGWAEARLHDFAEENVRGNSVSV